MSGERDPFEAFKEACMDALSKLPDVTAARLKVAYRLLRHGNRNWFRKNQRFLTLPSRPHWRRRMEQVALAVKAS